MQVGDVVRLKGGGPDMVITDLRLKKDPFENIREYIVCGWFDGNIYKEYSFSPSALAHAEGRAA